MAFSPFARFRNFTVENLKALLEVYPDLADKMSWSESGDMIESVSKGYKKTSYQQACQFGLEDRGNGNFRVQTYLYAFDDENLLKYIEFWIKTYFAPNPYVNSDDEPMLIYCELCKEILATTNLRIDYYDFFGRRIGGKSDDILMNALKTYCQPLKYEKIGDKHYFLIEPQNKEYFEKQVDFIENEFSIPDPKSRKAFFERYQYSNFCKFHGITSEIPNEVNLNNDNPLVKRITGGENILLYGVPGAGKSHKIATEYCNDPKYIERVVFHPDYTYSDFVGQILPRVKGKDLTYEFTPGPFTAIMKKAEADPGHMYYLIIEELNRGNAPAIFGEIFQLLDRKDEDGFSLDEVGESEYGIINYDVAKEVYDDTNHFVRIPSNLTILATMNTADQNVFTLDTAFQRRWNMEHIDNDVLRAKHSDKIIEDSNVSWGSFASVVNEIIVDNSAEIASTADKRLGAYFVKERELANDKFSEKVLKYLWDDAFKMDHDLIFTESVNSLEEVIHVYQDASPDKLKAVLRMDVYQKMLQMTVKKPTENSGDDENE